MPQQVPRRMPETAPEVSAQDARADQQSQCQRARTPHGSDAMSQSLSEQLSHLSSEDRAKWEESAARADRLDAVPPHAPPVQEDPAPEKRQRLSETPLGGQRIAGQVFPPPMPLPEAVANMPVRDPYAISVPSSGESVHSSVRSHDQPSSSSARSSNRQSSLPNQVSFVFLRFTMLLIRQNKLCLFQPVIRMMILFCMLDPIQIMRCWLEVERRST